MTQVVSENERAYLRAIYEPLSRGEPLPDGAWDDPAVDVPKTILTHSAIAKVEETPSTSQEER